MTREGKIKIYFRELSLQIKIRSKTSKTLSVSKYLRRDTDELDGIVVVAEKKVEDTFFVGDLLNLHGNILVDVFDFFPGCFGMDSEDIHDNAWLVRSFDFIDHFPF